MRLDELTHNIKINRRLEARNITIEELMKITFTIYDYEIKRTTTDSGRDWIKILIGYPEIDENGFANGNILAAEFHGSFQYLIAFLTKCEKVYGKERMLPIEDCRLDISCGVVFEDSVARNVYIDRYRQPSFVASMPESPSLFPSIPTSIPIPKSQIERDKLMERLKNEEDDE